MTNVVASWRAGYTPGRWTVLAGPTAVVAVDPDADGVEEEIDRLWGDVLASASVADLVGRLAALPAGRVPRLAVVFWDAHGLRLLIRGGIVVRDGDTGRPVADGEGVITWREVGLGPLRSIDLDLPDAEDSGRRPLPLVVGVVRAGRLRLDADPDAAVTSPQGGDTGAPLPAAADGVPPADRPPAALETDQGDDTAPQETTPAEDDTAPQDDTAPLDEAFPDDTDVEGEDLLDAETVRTDREQARRLMEDADTALMAAEPTTPHGSPPVAEPERPLVPAAICVNGHPNPPYASGCWVCGAEVPSQEPQPVPRPVLGRLRMPAGESVEIDRPILIGRAPSGAGFTGEEPLLVTVVSPGHDISRTHVSVVPEGWQILVTDLHSTNGTTVVSPGPGVDRLALQAGQPLSVAVGTLVELGDGVAVLIDAAS